MLVFVEFSTRSSGNSLIFLEESGERKLDNIQQKNSPFQFITKLLFYYRHFDKTLRLYFSYYLDCNYDYLTLINTIFAVTPLGHSHLYFT